MGYFDAFKPQGSPGRDPVDGATVTPIDPARASRYAATALTREVEAVRTATEGTRNDTLNTAAFSMGQLVAAGHIAEDDVASSLRAAGLAAGLEAGEVEATLRSGLRSGARTPRIVPDLPEAPKVTVLDMPATPDLDVDEDKAFWNARDILGHLHDFARARRVSPWALLGCVLARVVTATPFTVHLPPLVGSNAPLNLFVGLVGTSGAGKGGAERAARDALVMDHITTLNVGSGEGIAHGYMRRARGGELEWLDDKHAVLFSVPEIDSMAAQGDRKGATLMPQLRSGWMGEPLGFGYADPTKRLHVEEGQYRMCLIAGIQPGRAAWLLNDSDGGTPQRFLWLPATDVGAPDVAPRQPPPIAWAAPSVSSLVTIGGVEIGVCQSAVDMVDSQRLARLRGQGDALDGHALLARLKVAAAVGILDGRYDVSEEDWELSGVIMRKSDAVRDSVLRTLAAKVKEANEAKAKAEAERAVIVEERTADAAVKRVCKTIVRRLRRETGDGWLSASELRGSVAGRDRKHFNAATERLLEAGQVEPRRTGRDPAGHGGKGTSYRLTEKG